ncbi:MAG: RNA polymerase factor sigma-54 [Anaerovoracaceae bacterium]|jgi:RNA polymerase sigma-54 factor
MKLGHDITIEQTQKLIMTPELIQAIQILQYNSQELEAYVEEQILTNPVLEKVEKPETASGEEGSLENAGNEIKEGLQIDWAEHIKDSHYDDISYKQWEYDSNYPDYSYEQYAAFNITLTEHLCQQLQFGEIKKPLYKIVLYIIEALDENGYLRMSLNQIAKVFNVDQKIVEEALEIVQSFEPVGVGARNLSECLLLQLRAIDKDVPILCQVVCNHLEDLANNRLHTIAKALSVSVEEVQKVADIIKTLEPKPGREFDFRDENRYIVPDVTVEKVNEEYVVRINEGSVPRLTISPYYRRILRSEEKDSNISRFLTGRLNSAMWLIKSIEQRRHTIKNVVGAIVKYQRDFFEKGEKHLRTLTLKQIADEVGIHESTVSRSIHGKYMQTPRGSFEIKYFFTSGIQREHGGGIASGSIKKIIREIIEEEDPKSPYSDQVLAEILGEKGVSISRRTVAKYRDEMNMPSSSKRRRY